MQDGKTATTSVANLRAHLSELLNRVAFAGQRYVIERRGKPVAAIVPLADLEPVAGLAGNSAADPLLAIAGIWHGAIPDDEWDQILKEIYDSRDRDAGRPVSLDC